MKKKFSLLIVVISLFSLYVACDKESVQKLSEEEKLEYYNKLVIVLKTMDLVSGWEEKEKLSEVKLPNGEIMMFPDIRPLSAEFSQNGRFVAVMVKVDILGGIRIFDADSQKVLISGSFSGWPEWEENRISFGSIIHYGDGYTINSVLNFDNGEIIKGDEYLGVNHTFRFPSPFSENFNQFDNYKLENKDWGEVIALMENMQEYAGKHGGLSHATLFKDSSVSREEVLELMELSKEIYLKQVELENDQQRIYLFGLFDTVYPIVHKAAETDLISEEERVQFIEEFFEYMRFDKDQTPWLF